MTDAFADRAPVPAIGVSFEHRLDDHRSIVFQGHVPADCSDEAFNALLDKLSRASDRQKAVTSLPTHRGILEIKQAELAAEEQRYLSLQAERDVLTERWQATAAASGRRDPKPGPKERADHIQIEGKLAQSAQNLRDLKKQIDGYGSIVNQYEAKL